MLERADFASIEFGVAVNQDDGYYRIPVAEGVKVHLIEMLNEFNESFHEAGEVDAPFSPSEKYSSNERLTISVNDEAVVDLLEFYNTENIAINALDILALSNAIFYFAIFTTQNGMRYIGVKRPNQFKALLNRSIIEFIDDTLSEVRSSVFKLDSDFDFIIYSDLIQILHPTGFIYISNVENQLLTSAVTATTELVHRIGFVNFPALAEYVGTSKTCAKLIASIKSRTDLEQTDRLKLIASCQSMNIQFTEEGNMLLPETNHITDFLRLLDRREYEIDLTTIAPEIFIASSRKPKG
jgi:hypothetical protein